MDRDLAPALALIRQFEGCRLTPYRDLNGFWTVGYGHKILAEDGIEPEQTITKERAEAILQADVSKNAAWLEEDLEGIEVNDNQFCALLSLEFNIGEGRFEGSTLLNDLENGDYAAAAAQFGVWRIADHKVQAGLVKRRAAEEALFMTAVQ